MRSVRTRVLPEPAGAITRTGPAVVGDRRELVGGERRRRRCGGSLGHRLEEAGLDGSARGRPARSSRGHAPARPAVDPGVAGRLDHHVCRAPLVGARARRLHGPPPDRLALAGVVVVRPDQVVEAIERQVEVRGKRVDGDRRSPRARGTAPGRPPSETTTGSRSDPVTRGAARRPAAAAVRTASSISTRGASAHSGGGCDPASDDHAPAERGWAGGRSTPRLAAGELAVELVRAGSPSARRRPRRRREGGRPTGRGGAGRRRRRRCRGPRRGCREGAITTTISPFDVAAELAGELAEACRGRPPRGAWSARGRPRRDGRERARRARAASRAGAAATRRRRRSRSTAGPARARPARRGRKPSKRQRSGGQRRRRPARS